MAEVATPHLGRIFKRGWRAEEALIPGEPDPDYFDPAVADYLRGKDPRYFKTLLESTKADLVGTLADGMEAGEGYAELADRVQDVYMAQRSRAENIARTEAVMAQNGAGQGCRNAYRVPKKEWVCSFQNSRESHMAADGQIVPNDKSFRVGGTSMEHPGDPRAPLGEICRCQCQAVGNYSGKRMPDYSRKAYVEVTRQIQIRGAGSLGKALKDYFARQEKKVLAALRAEGEETGGSNE